MLTEVKLSRVWQHFNSSRTIVILTAFRDEKTKNQSLKDNKAMASKIKSAGFGYFYVEGHFPENEGTNDEIQVKEDSIFAIAESKDSKKLIDLAHKLANGNNQDSIIVKDETGIYFLEQNGSKEYLKGKMSPGAIGKYYTKLRNSKAGGTFVFESASTGAGFFEGFRNYIQDKKCEY